MRKIGVLVFCFIIYTLLVISTPKIGELDKEIIRFVQSFTGNISNVFFLLPDSALYVCIMVIAISFGCIFFYKKSEYKKCVLVFLAPILAYIINKILKLVVNRPRPLEFAQVVFPKSSSYPSTHSLTTFSLLVFCIYLLFKYSKNKILNYILSAFIIFWTLYVGFSRIALGVHNLTDVLGGYFLGIILVIICIKIEKKI